MYTTPPTGLNQSLIFCWHLLSGLKMCMWFGHNPQINLGGFFVCVGGGGGGLGFFFHV